MQTASIERSTKKDSPVIEIIPITELSKDFFDYFTWSKRALCSGVQLQNFFSASSVGMAKIICGSCPVKQECLIWALMYKEEGVWGGTTDGERKRLLPKYKIEEFISQAIRLNVYFPKRSVREIHESLAQAG